MVLIYFAVIWCGEPRRPPQSPRTKVLRLQDGVCVCVITLNVTAGVDVRRRRKENERLEDLQDYESSPAAEFWAALPVFVFLI